MIYYFSGTGNSKWVAEEIARELGDKTADISIAQKGKRLTCKKSEKIGIVFPVYSWSIPEIVMNFVKSLDTGESYTFAVCTCGDEAGDSIKQLSKLIRLDSGYSVIMPNNYIIGFDVDSDTLAKEKIQNAKIRLKSICEDIKANSNKFDVLVGKMPFLKSTVVAYGFNKFARNTRPFHAKKDFCNSCGLCEKICPAKTITLNAGIPAWDKKCYQCLACINRCPQKAIEYGKTTVNKGRYYFRSDNF